MKTRSTHTTRRSSTTVKGLGALALAASAGSLIAPSANAAMPVKHAAQVQHYVHQTAPTATEAKCLAIRDADVKAIDHVKSGGVTIDQCHLGGAGWQADVWYDASKAFAVNDELAQTPWAGEIIAYHYTHGTQYSSTKANATAHMQWTLAQMKAKPDDAVVNSAQVVKNANGTYSYVVSYVAMYKHPFFAEDSKTMWAIA